jgi:imidazolonepropionase-like amidohydrolase
LFDGISAELREDVDVLIEGNRIREVSDQPLTSATARVIDARGRTLMPGLIDAHYHAVLADVNVANLTRLSPYHLAQHARILLENSLRRGFTTVRDAGGADFGIAQAIGEGLIQGPRLFYSGRALSQTGGHGDMRHRGDAHPTLCACGQSSHVIGIIADGVAAVRQAAREELRKGATQIKIMASGGVASPADPIWNLQFSEEEIRAVVWETHAWRTYVMAHAYTPEAISRCVEYGVRSIEHANLIDAGTAALCARHDAFVVPTLVTYEALARDGHELGLPQVSQDKLVEVRDAGLRSLEYLRDAGVKTGFGTDLLGQLHRYQSEEFSIRAEVLTPLEILRQATSINAELLNRGGELGTIAADALADVLLVDGNPMEDLSLLQNDGRHLSVIMKDGKLIKHEE